MSAEGERTGRINLSVSWLDASSCLQIGKRAAGFEIETGGPLLNIPLFSSCISVLQIGN